MYIIKPPAAFFLLITGAGFVKVGVVIIGVGCVVTGLEGGVEKGDEVVGSLGTLSNMTLDDGGVEDKKVGDAGVDDDNVHGFFSTGLLEPVKPVLSS